jgi:enterochelin esterase-like enzyme
VLVAAIVVVIGLEVFLGPADLRARHGESVNELTINSRAVGHDMHAWVLVPAGEAPHRPRPLLVLLHGRNGNGHDWMDPRIYDAVAAQGKRAPIIAAPDGDDHSYWHNRAGGDYESYVVDEVIPRVIREFHADPHRIAIGGISMGGFGALDIARLNPGLFCAVGAHSPAIWHTGGETAPGAFDDAADFERHDVLQAATDAPGPYLGKPVWVDAGDRDPFRHTGLDEFADQLRAHGADIEFHIWPGEHNGDYWHAHFDDYLRFYSRALARCHQ